MIQPRSFALLLTFLLGCGGAIPVESPPHMSSDDDGTFARDLAFLEKHTDIILLSSEDESAQVAVAPQYQGRVMTSTANGPTGASFGYVHEEGIESGTRKPHMTVLGGEDRFWLGPEGGQFALYFEKGAPFDVDHWQVPEPIDWGAWPVTAQTTRAVTFQRDMDLTNYSGTRFSLRVERTVRLLDAEAVAQALGAPRANTYASSPTNPTTASPTSAMPLGRRTPVRSQSGSSECFAGPRATVVIPFESADQGRIVNDAYFGTIDEGRLQVADGSIFFRADGKKRSKIGVAKRRARDVRVATIRSLAC